MSKTIILMMGRSGCGKSTLERALCKAYPATFKKVVSFVTRPKRDGEIDGQDYHFLTRDEIENIEPFQSTEFSGNIYGTLLDEYTTPHRYLTFVITPNGVEDTIPNLKKHFPDIKILIIYFDISTAVLRHNMQNRGDTNEAITDRLRNDDIEQQFINQGLQPDYVVTDDTLNEWLSTDVLAWLKSIQFD